MKKLKNINLNKIGLTNKLYINDDLCFYNEGWGFNLYQLCLIYDFPVPRFCYHEKLTIEGNCRVCLVELEDTTKLILSCSNLPKPDISIYTDTEAVKDSQKVKFEYSLISARFDCGVCDQGGVCDFQVQVIALRSALGRFYESFKRAVEKYY